ncbi:HXXEE domain-containing protein [Streptococcus sp. 2021WUSS124]|uniref:HXXEE domain-containing protein n=1 Tax=unclassified Streptococcus TaxID=2608887 RepID=UPI002AADF2E1|nr:HXXEE domain-containing protein [Streptococcus suis]
MKFINNHWYDLCGLLAIPVAIFAILNYENMPTLQLLALLNFIVILLHQFEEYRFPGGGQALPNTIRGKDAIHDRYPLNQQNAMAGNLFVSLISYTLPIFFPNQIWLALMPVILGCFFQVIMHIIIGGFKYKLYYNPGVIAVVFGHVPIGIYFFWYTISNNLIGFWDIILGLVYMAFSGLLYTKLFYGKMADKNTLYPFTQDEMNRFDMYKKITTSKAYLDEK